MIPMIRTATVITLLACTAMVCAQDIFLEELLQIRIDFEDQNWFETLKKARQEGNSRLDAIVEINGVRYPGVHVRFKGNSSYNATVKAGFRKLPFNLKAAENHPFAGGYETIKLANNFRDPSGVRERLAYRIAGSYVPVPQCTHAVVFVNGEYLGVYTATEGINSEMVSRYFCYRKRGIIQCEPDFNQPTLRGCPKGSYASLEYLGDDAACYQHLYEVNRKKDWGRLIRLTRVLRDSTFMIEDVLNVHLTLWMHAVNNVLVNLDSYLGFFCHNYYLFLDHDGIFHPLMWDFNLAFGGFRGLKPGVEVDLVTLSPIVHERYNLENRPLITNLLRNDRYRRIYFAMIRTIVDDWFVNGRYLDEARALQEQIRPHVLEESGGYFDSTDFENSLQETVKTNGPSILGLAELMEKRTAYLATHPLLQSSALYVETWSLVDLDEGEALHIHTSPGVAMSRLWSQTAECPTFSAQMMERSGSAQQFTTVIRPETTAFYIELTGEDTANLWPLQAPGSVMAIEREHEK
jgi:hypothetical protein